jgi:hypothetical protein
MDPFIYHVDNSDNSLLSTHNLVFARSLTQIIYLRVQFLDHRIKRMYPDNAREYSFHTFDTYYILIDITVDHLVVHIHTQNV